MGQGLLGLAVPEVRPVTVYARYQEENMDRKAMARETLRVRSGWDRGRWTPPVVFFRDESFRLTETPVKASVLTLPAVNMGQVLFEGRECTGSQKGHAPENEAGSGNLCRAESKASGAWSLWMRRIPKRPRGGGGLVERASGRRNGPVFRFCVSCCVRPF